MIPPSYDRKGDNIHYVKLTTEQTEPTARNSSIYTTEQGHDSGVCGQGRSIYQIGAAGGRSGERDAWLAVASSPKVG
jgi:hypothetical protein